MSVSESIRDWVLSPLIAKMTDLKHKGEIIMSQLDDLNTKITAIGTGLDNIAEAFTKATADVAKSFADLKAAIQAGGGAPDLTNQLQAADSAIAKLSALSSNVSQLDTDALAADPNAVTPPTV